MEEFLSAAPRGKRQKNEANLNFSDDEDEDEPRVPKSSTDDIVEKEIKAEYAKKKAKAEEQRMGVKKKKVSFGEEMEEDTKKEEDGGAIMEDKVADARTVRQAAMRLNKSAATPLGLEATDVIDADVAEAEERERAPADGGELFESFNLDAERQDGFFDADGNYVEYKKDEDPDDKWLEGVSVDEALAEKTRKLAEPLTDKEEAQIKRDIAALLQPGETVLKGIKRLGGTKGGPGQKGGAQNGGRGGKQGRGQKPQAHQVDPANRPAFEKLTELSSLLMSHGEYEVYTFTKEAFEKSAKMLEPKAGSLFDRPAPVIGGAAAGASKRGASMFDDDDDMFAEADASAAKKAKVEAPAGAGGGGAAGAAGAGAAAAAPAAQESPPVDFAGWSISQLKQFLQRRGVSADGAVEKGDLVSRAKAAAQAAGLMIPAVRYSRGYVFDSQSGYYYGASSGLYYDLATGGFLNTTDKCWYLWDGAKNEFVKWEQA